MRNIALGVCSVIFLLMVVLVSSTVYGRSARQTELENALNESMKESLDTLDSNRNYIPKNNDELVAVFTQLFLEKINSKSSAQVEVLDVDINKRLLTAKATLTYSHLNGRPGTVTATKTVIAEQFKSDKGFLTQYYSWSENYNGNAIGQSATFHGYNGDNLTVAKDDTDWEWKLSAVTGIKDSNEADNDQTYEELDSIVMQDASGKDVTLTVGESYAKSYLSKLTIKDVDKYSSVNFTH